MKLPVNFEGMSRSEKMDCLEGLIKSGMQPDDVVEVLNVELSLAEREQLAEKLTKKI